MADLLSAPWILGSLIQIIDLSVKLLEVTKNIAKASYSDWEDFGLFRTALLYTVAPQARSVVARIRKHVLHDQMELQYGGLTSERFESIKLRAAEHASSIKRSYGKSLNIIAVAGAIIAQIAITGLSLKDVDQIHWIVEAAFVISLVAGLLSVYSACIMQVILGGMHSPDEVLKWLTALRIWAPAGGSIYRGRMIPSLSAAMMLVAPIQLLNWSLLSLLVGIGIYYGLLFTQGLGTLHGKDPNLAILLVYVIFTTGAVASFALPALSDILGMTRKAAEIIEKKTGKPPEAFGWDQELYAEMSDPAKLGHTTLQTVPQRGPHVVNLSSTNVNNVAAHPGAPAELRRTLDADTIIDALRASIDAQRASLSAQEALLGRYTTPSPAASTF